MWMSRRRTIQLYSAHVLFLLALLLGFAASGAAQCTDGGSTCSEKIPRLVTFNGALRDGSGQPRSGTVGVTFAIYTASAGGQRLWQETQNVQLDSQGHYEAMLGAMTEGLPLDLFSSGEPRWLGVLPQLPDEQEQPRVLLVSVPYALKAGDAETLGGLPASAFLKAADSPAPSTIVSNSTSTLASPVTASAVEQGAVAASGVLNAGAVAPVGATPNSIPKFSNARSLTSSQISDADGVVGMRNLANILFAEQFSGGVPDAINACPDAGCIIYALSTKVNRNLGNVDPGNKAITLYLGPYTFNVQQITLRKSMKIIGMGASGGTPGSGTCPVSSPCNGTTLQSVNGSLPLIVLPQANNAPATNVVISGLRLLGAPGNAGQDGLFLDTSSITNSGLWYATLDDIHLEGFSGIGVHLKGQNNNFGGLSQWVEFKKVIVFRTAGGGNGLRIEGANFQQRFEDCQFDGQGIGDGVNIYIGGLAGGSGAFPLNITFQGLVSQAAATAVQIDGANSITFHESHHEKLWGVYQITNQTNIGTKGVTISGAAFEDVGVNAGNGFLLNVATSIVSGLVFTHNQIYTNPDWVVKATNLAQVVYQDNQYSGAQNVPPTSGITPQLSPAATINIGGVHSVGLNPSATPITTIQSSLGPGEMVTFFTFAGGVTFASGGNLNLMGEPQVAVNGSITFVRNDLTGSLQWTPVSQWTP
jgi:hypothetical protein